MTRPEAGLRPRCGDVVKKCPLFDPSGKGRLTWRGPVLGARVAQGALWDPSQEWIGGEHQHAEHQVGHHLGRATHVDAAG